MGERLTGVRTHYADMPVAVRDWVDARLESPVVSVRPRTGGMSPAVAASITATNGEQAFVKAVGAEIHPDTPEHLRHETRVLQALPAMPYRAGLKAAYDDGDWVAILLDDVDGHHPDWQRAEDRDAVFNAVARQTRELTPPPAGVPAVSNREAIAKYLDAILAAGGRELAEMPRWVRDDFESLAAMLEATLDHHRDEAFCHWDIRHDNILLRNSDEQPVLVDWGMSRRGQRWGDVMCFGLEWVDSNAFDAMLASLVLTPEEEDDVTGFLFGLGCYCLIMALQPAHPSLPSLPAFRRDLGNRCLQGVRRRLSR